MLSKCTHIQIYNAWHIYVYVYICLPMLNLRHAGYVHICLPMLFICATALAHQIIIAIAIVVVVVWLLRTRSEPLLEAWAATALPDDPEHVALPLSHRRPVLQDMDEPRSRWEGHVAQGCASSSEVSLGCGLNV